LIDELHFPSYRHSAHVTSLHQITQVLIQKLCYGNNWWNLSL